MTVWQRMFKRNDDRMTALENEMSRRMSEVEVSLRARTGDLAREVEAMRLGFAALARHVGEHGDRIHATETALRDATAEITTIGARRETDSAATEDALDTLATIEAAQEVHEETLARLHTAISRLELQLDRNADEASKAATGLLQRIERARLTRTETTGGTLAPDAVGREPAAAGTVEQPSRTDG